VCGDGRISGGCTGRQNELLDRVQPHRVRLHECRERLVYTNKCKADDERNSANQQHCIHGEQVKQY
jgi:hypothetical protein